MQIILTKDVKGQGKKGEIITVKDGYGLNYLIKNNYGILANNSGMKKLNTEKKKNQEIEKENILKASEIKQQLEKIKLTFYVKTGVQDKVFGSISSKQIEKELKNKNINIDKKQIIIDNSISSLGTHIVKIELYKNITGELKVELLKEGR